MSQGKNNLPFGFDWTKLQEGFIEEKFIKPASSKSSLDLNWMGKYMNDVLGNISKNINQNITQNNQGENNINYELFETHDYTIVKMRVPDNIHQKNIKVFLDINKLKIQGLYDNLALIQLPVNGRYQGSRAIIKNEVIEIRVQKDYSENYREIKIQYKK